MLDRLLTPRVAKVIVSIWSTFPAIDLVRVLYQLDPDFINQYNYRTFKLAIDVSGRWAFVFLFLTLACTPVQRLVRSPLVPAVRRPLGLATFGYFVLHFLAYFVVGQKLHLEYTIKDSLSEPSRLPGWISLLLLIPLAITSTDGMVRRLGGKRWKLLHRLVYLSAAAAIYHTYLVETGYRRDLDTTRNALIVFVILILARFIRFKRSAASASS